MYCFLDKLITSNQFQLMRSLVPCSVVEEYCFIVLQGVMSMSKSFLKLALSLCLKIVSI